MADVSLDKTDPQIKHIRPITDDLITKFQLERPIILAYKVWTPYMPFEYKTVASSLTQVTLPYDIQSITGVWYYKYEDIMDDKQRFVRESRMIKGDPVLGYRIYPCETYDGIEYCYGDIYFDIPLTSRKIWIEGVGQAEGYLEASESDLSPVGDFQLKRLNVYSESKQMVIPDSGTKELPYNTSYHKLYWTDSSSFSSSPDNGDWQGPIVCHCREESDIYHNCWNYPTVSGSINISESIGTRTVLFKDINGGVRYQFSYQSGNWSNDIANRTETCHDFWPDFGIYTYRRDVTFGSWNGGYRGHSGWYNTQGSNVSTCSPNHPERWIAVYRIATISTKNTYAEQSSGTCTCGQLGAICVGGCWCNSGQATTAYSQTATYGAVINIGGSERILATGQLSADQSHMDICTDGDTIQTNESGPTYHNVQPSPVASLAVQKKKFETEDTTDAILGSFYYYTEIREFGVPMRTIFPNQITVCKYDEMGFTEKTWPYNREAEWQTIQGLLTNFSLTYVRL